MRRIVTILTSLFIAGSVTASDGYYSVLYGFKLGQPIANALAVFGEPQQSHTFPDGWQAFVFQLPGHNLVFEVNDVRPDLIISVQIEGMENADGLGLRGVNLGDPVEAAFSVLGEPDRQESAMNAVTREPVEGTAINFYGNGMTFEERDGVVSGIKIIYGGPAQATDEPDISLFFTHLQDRNYYGLSEMISSNLTIGSEPAVQRSMLGAIAGRSPLNAILYGERGLSSMGPFNDGGGSVRTLESGQVGFAMQLVDRSVAELVFTRSFEGWVLSQANPEAPAVMAMPEPEGG
jgi:hypothetical protein